MSHQGSPNGITPGQDIIIIHGIITSSLSPFNNKIVIGRRGGRGEGGCSRKSCWRVKRSSQLEQWSSVLFWGGVKSEYLDDVNIFILLQMYAATFSSIGKASSHNLLLYLETCKRKKKTRKFSLFHYSSTFFSPQLFLPFFSANTH